LISLVFKTTKFIKKNDLEKQLVLFNKASKKIDINKKNIKLFINFIYLLKIEHKMDLGYI
jgi:hypothetical protein